MDHHKDVATPPDGPTPADLAAGLAAQRERLDEVERSLVERIGDVDDDRRRTAVLLQRARQGQQEELATWLRRHRGRHLVSLAAIACGLVVALAALYVYTDRRYQELVVDIERIERTVGQHAAMLGDEARDPRLGALADELERVAAVVAERDLGRVAEAADLAGRLRRLEDEQRTIAARIATLTERRSASLGDEATPPSAPDEAPTASPPHAGEPIPDVPAPSIDGAVVVGERRYALQLVGYFERERLTDFATRADLPRRLYYREESYLGRPWFVLIHSLHGSYDEAVAARAALAPELAALEPLVRRLPVEADVRVLNAAPRSGATPTEPPP
ncbi:hypothetical protein ABC977_14990 [Thioalkalicoccus limnaeus]|uniref:SPOR domain-containing protein n=1 Tax=Thioalkalicoccus limnaeus TaxID=120681 RepID=A0ABV4BGR6_9GAMM